MAGRIYLVFQVVPEVPANTCEPVQLGTKKMRVRSCDAVSPALCEPHALLSWALVWLRNHFGRANIDANYKRKGFAISVKNDLPKRSSDLRQSFSLVQQARENAVLMQHSSILPFSIFMIILARFCY
jgi:hypothetical protein